jgi:hypothetical protein
VVAYKGRLFIYKPRSILKQSLPQHPDAVLKPPESRVAMHIGGYLDKLNYHCINHLIIGFLGHEEIVVASFDDGDVIAYYTKDIADYVSHRLLNRPDRPRFPIPFVVENVGLSAWGLAVHTKSRLIAVSSNRHEVTVFAFGLTQPPTKRISRELRRPGSRNSPAVDHAEKSVLRRKRNWRIVILLGHGALNLPNISFLDDEDGLAEKICAVDLSGTIWILDIWKAETAPIKILHQMANDHNQDHLQL